MAVCKHNTSQNGFAASLEYLTSQHDPKGRLLRNGDGVPVLREQYLIQGINCLPETFAACCLQDRINFGKGGKGVVDTHQYIISFAPSDVEKGLTMEEAQRYGYAFAKKNFQGHRMLVCTHPDGGKAAGNIHVHIVISALRYADREPDARFMRLRPDGSVKPSEYRAGCAHQDTAVLRKYLLAQVNAYCRLKGYVICPEKAADKISQKEYLTKARGIETRNDQLRWAVADAAMMTCNWDEFAHQLRTGYIRKVPVVEPIPYMLRNKLWESYKQYNGAFWEWDKAQRAYWKDQLWTAKEALKLARRKEDREVLQQIIADIREKQSRERVYRDTFQSYARAATTALRSQNREDAQLCVERMQELVNRLEGYWEEGWNQESRSFSLVNGFVESRITWEQTREEERDMARQMLESVREEAEQRKSKLPVFREEPMSIEVKITRGEVSFRHPDSERWVRGKRLGDAYTLDALGIELPRVSGRNREWDMDLYR